MPGMNKRSTDPKSDQTKMNINPLYNTSALLKAALDRVVSALDMTNKSNSKPPKKTK